MADGTKIEWTDATWQVITGCSVVSPGCTNCYAMKLAGTRLRHHPSREGLTIDTKAGPVWNGQVRFNEEWLDQPLRWKTPRMIFVCAHGDLFHESVELRWILKVFDVMERAHWHTFQVLTKRAARMQAFVTHAIPNVWLGVSVEDQARADERIPLLLQTPAAKRWISAEPLLGPVDLRRYFGEGCGDCDPCSGRQPWSCAAACFQRQLDWVVAGGESGPGARPMRTDWARTLRDQCSAAGVPFLHKQNGAFVEGPVVADESWDGGAYVDVPGFGITAISHAIDHKDGFASVLVGKKAAGRLLDGVEHNGFPT